MEAEPFEELGVGHGTGEVITLAVGAAEVGDGGPGFGVFDAFDDGGEVEAVGDVGDGFHDGGMLGRVGDGDDEGAINFRFRRRGVW